MMPIFTMKLRQWNPDMLQQTWSKTHTKGWHNDQRQVDATPNTSMQQQPESYPDDALAWKNSSPWSLTMQQSALKPLPTKYSLSTGNQNSRKNSETYDSKPKTSKNLLKHYKPYKRPSLPEPSPEENPVPSRTPSSPTQFSAPHIIPKLIFDSINAPKARNAKLNGQESNSTKPTNLDKNYCIQTAKHKKIKN